jgi:hypothetical protein
VNDHEDRQLRLLEEMRDLLREDVRLRQVALDEQRNYQTHAQQTLARAGRLRSWTWILLLLLGLWLAGSMLLPALLPGVRAGLGARWLGAGNTVIPSHVETSLFDGDYFLLEDRSFAALREKVLTDSDAARRVQGVRLLAMEAGHWRPFSIRHGVIHAGSVLTQEFSLLSATISGTTLRGRAMWHEDIHDPGDMSEESIVLRLDGGVLEFTMLDELGAASDPVFLRRATSG